jgi:ABC-2 type transport system ATP-binding protein
MLDDVSVHAQALTRRFGAFTAVDAISLDVRKGEIFGFLGANGAGKTTAIRMFCGLLSPTSGEARVGGYDVATQPELIRNNIGYMSQKFSLYEDLTVAQNIEFYGGMYGLSRRSIVDATERMLNELDMHNQRDTLTRALPLGWKQRLALSAALLHQPGILFLDEPTGGVDPISRRNFWRIIYDIAEAGTTVFVTTHYMDEAEYCGRVSIMHQGRIIAMGTPSELKREHGLGSMQEIFVHLIDGSSAVQENRTGGGTT